MAATERITGLLDEPETILDVDDPLPLGEIQGRVEFRHVWFAYTADNWVVRDLSFTVEPGERVAVVGATGAGKSTLIHLLNRFYDVQRGTILVDGKPIRHVRQRELRRNVGIVLQDPFMLTDTLRENVRLRDDTIDDDAVRAAVEAVGADALVARLEGGYDAVLAERGANLSTGEKQLIALARVAAFNPRIVLVMDEATASIDPQTEARVQAGMQAVTQGRTALIIAHRLNTIRHVDRILVLEHGRLVESGSHDELLALGGRYARLYRLQYAEHAPA